MKPELKKGHRWLREGEIIRKGDWFYDPPYAPRLAEVSIGYRVTEFCLYSFSRPIKKRRATK